MNVPPVTVWAPPKALKQTPWFAAKLPAAVTDASYSRPPYAVIVAVVQDGCAAVKQGLRRRRQWPIP